MKMYFVLMLAVILINVPKNTEADFNGYEVVSKLSIENITLYAKEINGLYQDFKIDFKGDLYSRPFWMNVTNPTYGPDLLYVDINQDGKKELIITLTKGYGTGVLQEEVYVYRYTNGLNEVLVDNPLAIIYKNLETELSAEKAEVSIGDKVYKVDITPLKINPLNLFKDIAFGGITDYEVQGSQLVVRVSGRISPTSIVGEIIITYEFRDKMYQAKSIDFQPIEL